MLRCFELEKFTRSEIQNVVRKTNLFKEKEIFDVLEVKYDEIEKTLRSFMDQESLPPQAQEERMEGKRKAKQANMERKIVKQEVESNSDELSVKQEFDRDGHDNSSTDNGQKEEEYFENGKYKEELEPMMNSTKCERPKAINPGSIKKFNCGSCKMGAFNRNELVSHWISDCKLVPSELFQSKIFKC